MKIEVLSRVPASPRKTPLLFVHGSWHGAWCWDVHFLDYFAERGFAAHALSLRGHGGSAGRERLRWTRMRDYVDDVAQVAASLTAPPVVIGHSMGGFIVQKYLENHAPPAAVLLASVPPQGAFNTALKLGGRHPALFLKANLTMTMYPMVSTPALAREAFFSADLPEAALNAYWAKLQDESFTGFLDMLMLDLPKPVKTPPPVLVLGAERDSIFGPDAVNATARRFGVNAEWLPGIAHDAMLDTGWRSAADAILAWLNRTLPPDPTPQ